jgi:type I restriction enzyme R subunit
VRKARHEPAQGDQLRDKGLRLARRAWLALRERRRGTIRPSAGAPADLVAWVQASQPKAWEQLASNHGSSSTNVLLDRVRKQLDDRGALDVLRHGVEMLGLKQQLMLAQFRPALG